MDIPITKGINGAISSCTKNNLTNDTNIILEVIAILNVSDLIINKAKSVINNTIITPIINKVKDVGINKG